ncbi:hypothetical protein PVK06_020164 [Gossypium arboreum]|uniref:Retrovirus-related Pol polyprotein from transposon TNT 1-94-like beta-barrel domain-containing protein n=1 Tax=Gossypium arboreum TaxID=29729 RepID=A0ABR0PM48_GOSAR|nr:hypothetical protein PVK06_020164 [Gossypium arboreum]
MMATSSDSDSSGSYEDSEVANLCPMAIEEPKASNSKKNSWYLGSGCFGHICDKSHFIELKPNNEGEVTFGDNFKGLIEGIGFIGINSSTFIKNVLYVNGLKHNLLNISQLCDNRFKVILEFNGCKVVDIVNNRILL